MRVALNEIAYPVIGLGRSIWYFKDEDSLTETTTVGMKKEKYEGMRIVDSKGDTYLIQQAAFKSGIGIFGGFNLFGGRRIRISLTIIKSAEKDAVSLSDLKGTLEKMLRLDPIHNTTDDYEERSTKFNNSPAFASLIAEFGISWYRKY